MQKAEMFPVLVIDVSYLTRKLLKQGVHGHLPSSRRE